MSESPWQDKETLYRLYVKQGLSTADIGEQLGCTGTTISDWLDRHNIETRDPDPPTMTGEDHPRSVTRDDLIEDYKKVADELGKTPSQIEYNQHEDSYTWSAIRGHFDSMGELQEAAELERLNKGRIEVECEVCGTTFSVKHAQKDTRRCCSEECIAEWKKKAYSGENNHNYKENLEFTCEWCGDSYNEPPSREGSTRFCSQECMIEWRSREYSGEDHPRWKDNDDYYRGPNWHRQREKARDRDGNECRKCGSADQLSVHHIKPYESFEDHEEANKLQNLITLCKSCHHQLEWGSITVQSGMDIFAE